jgi:hypothetical protein
MDAFRLQPPSLPRSTATACQPDPGAFSTAMQRRNARNLLVAVTAMLVMTHTNSSITVTAMIEL